MAYLRLAVILSVGLVLLMRLDSTLAKGNQTRIFGEVGPEDKLVYKEVADAGFLFGNPIVENYKKNVTYPPLPATEGVKLTCIKVLDGLLSGQNSNFYISQGGVNQTHATVYFFGREGYGFYYTVEFYGK